MDSSNKIFTNLNGSLGTSLDDFKSRGVWCDIDALLSQGRERLSEVIKSAEIRGRGGAGFPAGTKWGFLPKTTDKPVYLVVNADEAEPGACKDRELLRNESHRLLEGIFFASYIIGAHTAYIFIRGENYEGLEVMERSIAECNKAGLLGNNAAGSGWNLNVHCHKGAGAYICGEETALLESLEGKRGLPRIKPPFPAIKGLYGSPTIINNVETLCVVPTILRRGSVWWRSLGTENNYGTKIFSVSGNINNPVNVEEELGISFRDLIDEHADGISGGWNNFMCAHPGGSSSPILVKEECENLILDFDSVAAAGSMLGTASLIIANKEVDIIKLLERNAYFYAHESCGQCTPCREGTQWLLDIYSKALEYKLESSDINDLERLDKMMCGTSICALSDSAAWSVRVGIRKFKGILLSRVAE